MTDSTNAGVSETERGRAIQQKYNREHGITPATIKKAVRDNPSALYGERDYLDLDAAKSPPGARRGKKGRAEEIDPAELPSLIEKLRGEMRAAAQDMEFERAAELRDRIRALESR